MLSQIPPEITLGSFSLVGILTGYIWNDQSKRIKKLEDDISTCPFPDVRTDIATMKTDLKWIKHKIINDKY